MGEGEAEKSPERHNEGPAQQNRKSAESQRCYYVCAAIPLVLAFAFYFMPFIIDEWEARYGYGVTPFFDLPPGVMDQFRVYDANGDGFIDPSEFVALGIRIREENDRFQFEDAEMGPDKEVVVVKAEFEPIVLDTMTKFGDKQEFYFGAPEQILPGLVLWKTTQHPIHAYGAGNFRAFLPPSSSWHLGKPYHIIDPILNELGIHMNRYRPSVPIGKEILLHTLLTQFHPNIFLHTRFGPRGSLAVVRARSEKYLDIVMRVHAEYQLNEEPNFPFWFTPAQFSGRLIIDTEAKHIEHFELALPTNKQLNIDMEWITGADSNEVDIGYVPKMELRSFQPSGYLENGTELNMTEVPFDPTSIQWYEEIPLSEAKLILERAMYPFKKLPYHSFLDAFELAFQEHKLVHSILLWGALDDQSC